MRLIIEPNYEQLSKWAANYVAAKIKKANPTAEKPLYWLAYSSSPSGHVQESDRTEQTGGNLFPEYHNFQYGRICRFTERPS